jgi:hypothetical protein
MSRIVEAILGYRRCDCKCNKVQQPVIIKNNIFGQQSSGSGISVPVGAGTPYVVDISQTQVWNLTPGQYYLREISPNYSMLIVSPSYLDTPGFIYQLSNASTVTVSITVYSSVAALDYFVSKFEPETSDIYMKKATMSSSAVSDIISTLTAETSTFDTSVLNKSYSIDFLVYNDRGYLAGISNSSITGVTITITYSAGGGFNNSSA